MNSQARINCFLDWSEFLSTGVDGGQSSTFISNIVLNGLHLMARREDRNLHPLINCPHVSQQHSTITHYTHLNILNLASTVFFLSNWDQSTPPPLLNPENNMYYVQVAIEENKTLQHHFMYCFFESEASHINLIK